MCSVWMWSKLWAVVVALWMELLNCSAWFVMVVVVVVVVVVGFVDIS